MSPCAFHIDAPGPCTRALTGGRRGGAGRRAAHRPRAAWGAARPGAPTTVHGGVLYGRRHRAAPGPARCGSGGQDSQARGRLCCCARARHQPPPQAVAGREVRRRGVHLQAAACWAYGCAWTHTHACAATVIGVQQPLAQIAFLPVPPLCATPASPGPSSQRASSLTCCSPWRAWPRTSPPPCSTATPTTYSATRQTP